MVKEFVFDSELGDYAQNPEFQRPVLDDQGAEPAGLVAPDEFANEAMVGPELLPPDSFSVSAQIVRNNPDGSTTVDLVLEVSGALSAQYEVRVTR